MCVGGGVESFCISLYASYLFLNINSRPLFCRQLLPSGRNLTRHIAKKIWPRRRHYCWQMWEFFSSMYYAAHWILQNVLLLASFCHALLYCKYTQLLHPYSIISVIQRNGKMRGDDIINSLICIFISSIQSQCFMIIAKIQNAVTSLISIRILSHFHCSVWRFCSFLWNLLKG